MDATSPSTEASPSVDGPKTTETSPSVDGPKTMETSPSVDGPKITETSPSVDGPPSTSLSVDGPRDYVANFQCCICLELVFKPLVLACGHITCSWCMHLSMKTSETSECPLCRQPHWHFPRVCGMLHRVLLKVVPEEYKRRETEVLDKEREGAFSLQVPDDILFQTDFSVHGNNKVSVADLSCAECKKLLIKPVVRICGHVYCKSCLKEECKLCLYPHLEQFPKVCLILDSLIQKHFPELYRNRSLKRQFDDIDYQENVDLSTEAFQSNLEYKPWSVHRGVGCDVCGMFPICGKRYRCKDCIEPVGYDLCEGCYDKNLNLPGRFNQKHSNEHTFIVDGSMLFR